MKPLLTIIILLSCLSGWGQKDTIRYEMMIDNDVIYLVPTKDDALISFGGLIDYWQSYKDECYADSTTQVKHAYRITDYRSGKTEIVLANNPPNPDELGIYKNYLGKRITYTHRKTTFEGFMDYMERKYKPTKQ